MQSDSIHAYLSGLPFWTHLSVGEQDRLTKQTQVIHYKAKEMVASGGDCLGALFLQTGTLRVYLLSEDGRETTINRLRPGETCVLSASCLISAITFDVHIDAETDCDAYLLPAGVMAGLMEQNVHVQNYIYKLTIEHFSKVISAVERIFFMSLQQRIAAFLIDESAQQKTAFLALTQEQLAQAIGSAREAVSRTLKQMSKAGTLEVTRGGIRILNKSRLYQEL